MSIRVNRNESHLARSKRDRRAPAGELVSLAVAAETFSVSTKTLRRRIADGTVRGYRVGRLIRVDVEEVREALVVVMQSAR